MIIPGQTPDGRNADRKLVFSLYDLLGYRRRWQVLSPFVHPYISKTAPIILGGCGSSGTTLTHALLASHPDVASGPESTVFLSRITPADKIDSLYRFSPGHVQRMQRRTRSQAEFIDQFQHEFLRRENKAVWVEKTPWNVTRLAFIWKHFPSARFVHVLRDGRDVACSLRTRPWMKFKASDRLSLEAFQECVDYWVSNVKAGRRFRTHPQYYEVHYEDLVKNTETTLRGLMYFLELDWRDEILKGNTLQQAFMMLSHREAIGSAEDIIHTNALARWQKELSVPEIQMFNRQAGRLLVELGYQAYPKQS